MQTQLSIDTLLIVAVVSYVLHLIISAIVLYKSESTRKRLIEVGNKLIAREGFDERQAQHIRRLLGTVFSWRILIIGILFFATVPVKKLLDLVADESIPNDEMLGQFYKLHLQATMAASPILGLILRLILFIRRKELTFVQRMQEANVRQKNKPTTIELYEGFGLKQLTA